jgi:malonyl CoA-acyl carrier protein transacylase
VGQVLAARRAWENAGLDPASATLVEAHGTSTKVGDVVEVESLAEVFQTAGRGRVGLGSAKGNIGHLKAGAGAAGLLKAVFAVHYKTLPPTLNCERPNPNIDFPSSPFFLVHEPAEWAPANGDPRRCGVSAYGFGGTNFHLVIEEHVPGLLAGPRRASAAVPDAVQSAQSTPSAPAKSVRNPLRGIVALGAVSPASLKQRLDALIARVRDGYLPPVAPPAAAELRAPERLVIDFGTRDELLDRLEKAERALGFDTPQAWKALQSQGVFRGSGSRKGKIAFLFPGQGSQYVNMAKELAACEPAVAGVFAEADRTMERILGEPLTNFIFVDEQDPASVERAEESLRQTAVTQPAVLTVDRAIERLLIEFGVRPDFVMGHSLGEYAALVAAGVMPFDDALEASAARGREMTRVSVEDNGWMAAIMAPLAEVHKTLETIDGYVVVANINGYSQSVIGGNSEAVRKAIEIFSAKGYQAIQLPVSHAFHTRIVAPAAGPLRSVLDRLRISPPTLPLIANVTGELYPQTIEGIKDILAQQIASPVQWVKGLETLYAEGVRTFVEVGPKKALKGLVDDVLGSKPDVVSLHTNHPKPGGLQTLNQALCGLYAAGWGLGPLEAATSVAVEAPAAASRSIADPAIVVASNAAAAAVALSRPEAPAPVPASELPAPAGGPVLRPASQEIPVTVDVLAQAIAQAMRDATPQSRVVDRNDAPRGSVVISGPGLGLPGPEKSIMDPSNVDRILRGEQFIDLMPERFRSQMARKHGTRVVKSEDGSGRFETIDDTANVIKLAGRPGAFDLTEEYGVPAKLVEALDTTTQLAMAAGLDALREAGIPLIQTWRKTTTGKYLPDRWLLPESMRDDTGVVFTSAFPGYDRFSDEAKRYFTYEARLERRRLLEELRSSVRDPEALREIHRRIVEVDDELAREPYAFDRRFLFRILSMGHSQFAEYIGARGPNAHANAACASTAQGVAMAEDWIRTGRCRRVVIIGADNVTGEHLMEWIGSGFLATGAAAIDDKVEEAAVPFDRRRHGTILGMGACALVVESQDAVEERGMRGIAELLASEVRNSAFHGTRLDVAHVSASVESLVASGERRFGLSRQHIAPQTVFVSHETYTPARGGSASAEIAALRSVFGASASEIVMANTKGFTGHPMGVGIEDVIAVKILEHGVVPPVPNFKEVDPELGPLTLSRGGRYPVKYAIHLAAGFGSQVALTLTRRIPGGLDRVDNSSLYQHWLDEVSGYDRAELEVVKRTLRVVSKGVPPHAPAPNRWRWGTEPTRRAPAPGDDAATAARPAPMAPPSAERPVLTVEPGPVADRRPPTAEPPGVAAGFPAGRAPSAEPAPTAERRAPTAGSAAAPSAGPQVPSPEPRAPSAAPREEVSARVLAIVAEKTGYPPDMLEMDLDLEADLGVDTVKQAETFAAVREAYQLPREDTLRLRDFPTLRHVVQFVLDRRPDLAAAASAEPGSGLTAAIPSPEPAAAPSAGPQVPSPEPQAPSAAPREEVSARVLAIVAEKTGYPPDMLEMDLDLEADLGVDTVKQAETFAAVREAYQLPREDTLRLRDFPTLRHVVQFVLDRRPDLAAVASAEPAPGATAATPSPEPAAVPSAEPQVPGPEPPGAAAGPPAGGVPSAEPAPMAEPRVQTAEPTPGPSAEHRAPTAEAAFPRRVVVPSLRPGLDLCKPTGVVLGAGSRVIVARDEGDIGEALEERLTSRGATVLSLARALDGDGLDARVDAWLADGPVHGVYWLPALDAEPALDTLDLHAFRRLNHQRVKRLYRIMRRLYERVSTPGTFLVAGTRMGGLHGQGRQGADAPLGGSVCGFAKAYKRERPQVIVKAVDFELSASTWGIADALIAETLSDPGAVEIGFKNGLRWTLSLTEQPAANGEPGLVLDKDSVFVVTGAAGGITSAIVADLAVHSGGTFYLLDLVGAPSRSDPYVASLRSDREALKLRLIDEAKARGERPTPVAIDKQLMAIERVAAALAAIEAVEAAGGTAHYRSVDLRDGPAVAQVVDEVRARHGRIDVLLHAGGIEISRPLPDKPPEEFERVFDIKVDGFFSLLKAASGMPVGATVVFSSVAGRFGNTGQADYSAANALLCAMSRHLRKVWPGTRAIAVDWTAWGGIGMATRGSIPKIMEAAGIEMLPPEVGIPIIRRELTAGSTADELVVGGRLGMLVEPWDVDGGLDLAKMAAWLSARERPLVMVGRVTGASLEAGLTIETTLDPREQPFLHDHQIEGTPVLPGVMGMEAFAEAASVLCPGYTVEGLENVEFRLPFKFFRMQPATMHLTATGCPGDDDGVDQAVWSPSPSGCKRKAA